VLPRRREKELIFRGRRDLWDDPKQDDLGRYWMTSRRYRKEVARV
jgi:hypothetical protein